MKKKVLAFACAMMVTASLTACGINEVVNGTAPSSSQRQGELANSPVSTSVVHNPQGNPHKILVAYFTYPENTDAKAIHSDKYDVMSSASLKTRDGVAIGNNTVIADYIANQTGGDLFSILTEKPYPTSYDETVDQGKEEIQNQERPALKSHVGDLSGYDTIVLVYPNWWSTLPAPVQSFLKETDMSGKQVYAIVTSGGSGFSDTIQTIQQAEPGASVHEGFALHHNDMDKAEETTQKWLNQIGFTK